MLIYIKRDAESNETTPVMSVPPLHEDIYVLCNPGRVSELNFLFMSYRYTAIGLECGTFITFIVDLESNEVVEKLTFSFEGPLTKVIFFPTEGNRLG